MRLRRCRSGRALAVFLSGLLGVILGGGLVGWLVLSQQERHEVAQPFVVAPEGNEKGSAITEAVKRAGPAVVQVITKLAVGGPRGVLPELFGIPQDPFPEGRGSGVVVNAKKGYVITNAHVIEGAQEMTVKLMDQREFKGKEIARDRYSDLAVVQIKPDRLPAITLGSSQDLPIGSWVIAIGNPFDFENTVTVGVLSARDRQIEPPGRGVPLEDLLQTDAAINRGNSGGALVNLRGELVGIPTAIIPPTQAQGLGFAVSVERVKEIVPELIAHGRVRRTWLGIRYSKVSQEDADRLNLPGAKGFLVAEVSKGGPAGKAGLRVGDIILSVERKPLRQQEDLRRYVRALKPGDTVTLDILRSGRKMKTPVRLEEMPSQLPAR